MTYKVLWKSVPEEVSPFCGCVGGYRSANLSFENHCVFKFSWILKNSKLFISLCAVSMELLLRTIIISIGTGILQCVLQALKEKKEHLPEDTISRDLNLFNGIFKWMCHFCVLLLLFVCRSCNWCSWSSYNIALFFFLINASKDFNSKVIQLICTHTSFTQHDTTHLN